MHTILIGDAREQLATIPDGTVQTCVTSPPYYGLRDYNVDGQIGLEQTVDAYVDSLVDVFREVRRVLRDDGTLWLNLGDSYAGGKTGRDDEGPADLARRAATYGTGVPKAAAKGANGVQRKPPEGLKPKDLIGVPWRVAFALQADGWYLRSEIIWHKPNPMPESVTDRPTKAHETVFLMSKSPRYYYDAESVREPSDRPDLAEKTRRFGSTDPRAYEATSMRSRGGRGRGDQDRTGVPYCNPAGRNKRSVWTVSTKPYSGAHFAVFPPKLIEPCILAGSREGDTVLDPFAGSGTTGAVAELHGRHVILIELNPEYRPLIDQRLAQRTIWQALTEVS